MNSSSSQDSIIDNQPKDYLGPEGGVSVGMEAHVAPPIVERSPAPNIGEGSSESKPAEPHHVPSVEEDLAMGRVRTALSREYTPTSGDGNPEATAEMMEANERVMEEQRTRGIGNPVLRIISGVVDLFRR